VRKTKSDVELYNLREDPLETRDLADSLPDKVADLTKQLDAWWQPSR
jgi:hypothetical protein